MGRFIQLIAGVAIMVPLLANGISRVGNGGLTSVTNGYSLTVPSEFTNVQIFPDENARLFNLTGIFSTLKAIDLRNFAGEFPELNAASSKEIAAHLAQQGWTTVPSPNFCGMMFTQSTATTEARIAVWATGKGFVLIADKTSVTTGYLDTVLSSVQLEPGSCEW